MLRRMMWALGGVLWGLLSGAEAAGPHTGGVISLSLCVDAYVLALSPWMSPEQRATFTVSRLAQDNIYSPDTEGGALFSVHGGRLEEIMAKAPRLVIGGLGTSPFLEESLERLGVPLLRLQEVHQLEDILENIHLLTKALSEEKAGHSLGNNLRERLVRIALVQGQLPPRKAVFYQVGTWQGVPEGVMGFFFRAGNLTSAFEHLPPRHQMSLEEMLNVHPDIVIYENERTQSFSLTQQALVALETVQEQRFPVNIHEGLCATPYTLGHIEDFQRALSLKYGERVENVRD